jgi:phage host-nuclease inhibitor protein Gam
MTTQTNSSSKPQQFVAESQKERWMKYGANVALSIIVVILLAGLVTYLAQKFSKRVDTTEAGLYSLKPQTVNLIKDNKQKIKLVSLYSAKDAQDKPNPYAGPVQDLIEEYARKGKNIEAETIDPVKEPTRTDTLVKEAISKYGGAVKAYEDFLKDYRTNTHEQLKKLTDAEAAAVASIPADNIDEESGAAELINTIQTEVPNDVSRMKERVDRGLKSKFPDYKQIVDNLKESGGSLQRADLALISDIEGQIAKLATTLKDNEKVPAAIREYLTASQPRHEAIKKLVDDTIKKIDGLGELKVGELQQAIKSEDLILVLGDTDWRVINPNQVWVADTSEVAKSFAEGQDIKPQFAGEQAVTTAILSLTSGSKPKVVFVRPGGAPLTTPGFPPFQRGGPFSELGEKLRDYNFDVLEKDISGQYAMQAQMQGQQAPPEPSDEEIKDAVWVVLDLPSQMGPAPDLAKKLADHLKAGGAAMVLTAADSSGMNETLKEYGIEVVNDATIVHEAISADRARGGDFAEEVQRSPVVFVLNKYGDHMLTQPLRSLDFVVARAAPVKTIATPGVKTTALLPIPQNLKIWGERDSQSISDGKPKFDESGPNADVPPPLYAGAVAEKDKTRLVVIGNLYGFTNQALTLPDEEMLKQGILVSRFPGNGEMFANAVFWLDRMEPMIAISPAAMQVSRIAAMSDTSLAFWRVGVLMILLPGLVVAAGIMMYFARRD